MTGSGRAPRLAPGDAATTAADYDAGWSQWSDMVRYSPAPFHRRRLIVQLARGLGARTVLDVGCGTGEMLRVLHEALHPDRLVGVDLSPAVVDTTRRQLPFADFAVADISRAALDEQFDLVVATEVLEHIEAYPQALDNLRRMCRGHVIVTVPSGTIYPIDRHMGHRQHFSTASLTAALEAASFEVVELWQWGFPWHSLYKRAINSSPDKMLNRFGGGEYTWTDKVLSKAVTWLFYTNLKHFGSQLVVLAKAK
jgi:ubiquinone/menaquinone biosynthesis C-methylase UbiE